MNRPTRLSTRCVLIVSNCVVPLLAGCYGGSLATSTGGGEWSAAPRQDVHVDEVVGLSFMLTRSMQAEAVHAEGLADYCVFRLGEERIDTEVDERGGFKARCAISDFAPGDSIKVTATAFKQNDARDHMLVGDEWLTNQSPNNRADEAVASSSVRLDVYQSLVHFELPRRTDAYDFATAQLVIRRQNGERTVVFEHRPPRRGFVRTATDDGGWTIEYLPAGVEVNPSGFTDVEFTIHDHAGNRHVLDDRIPTP